ncbi:MAG: dual specificity protein phosphatase family protein [Myxococcota bacterium]
MQWSAPLALGPGLTIGPAPGSYGSSTYAADLQQLHAAGFRSLVSLIKDPEYAHLVDESSREEALLQCEELGMATLHVPIEDFSAPQSSDIDEIGRFIQRQTAPVYLHCMAGLGRSGTVAAALLIQQGMSTEDAILLVRWARPGAIQSDVQERFLSALRNDE